MKLKKTMFLLALIVLMLEISTCIFACTGVIVGRGLTTDGSFIFGRNEDFLDEPEHNKNFVVHARGKNEPGAVFKDESNGFTYPIPETRFKYIAVPDVTPEEGIYDEAGYNEYGVAIDTTVSAKANENIKKVDPYVKDGLAESAMPTVILPYVKTAREGVMRLAEIIKAKGSAEGNILVIADKNEMWYIEIYSGHEFVAIKYPDDKFSVFPNTYFLGAIDLNDKDNVIKSDNIEKVARDAGSYVVENGRMHLAKSYGPAFEERNRSRAYSGILQLNPKAAISYNDDRFEFFQSSDKKISLQDVMGVLRNRLENTEFLPQMDGKKGENYKYAINNENVIESHIFQIKKDLPANVGGIMWLTMASSKYSPYIPYYGNTAATYSAYHVKGGKYDPNSYYWVSETVNTAMNKVSEKEQKEFFNQIRRYEDKKISEQRALDRRIAKMSPKEAERFATELALKNGREGFTFVKNKEKELKK